MRKTGLARAICVLTIAATSAYAQTRDGLLASFQKVPDQAKPLQARFRNALASTSCNVQHSGALI